MINFEILGRITASQDTWVATLTRQQQHLLAVLVLAGGRFVDRQSLQSALWDGGYSPDGGVKRVVSELRSKLQPAYGDEDPVPGTGDAYRLRVTADQADVLRFRTKLADARRAEGSRRIELMSKALGEWGDGGLYGGRPLGGLSGQWVDSHRTALRHEHREAVMHRLEQDLSEQRYDRIVRECALLLAEDSEALHDTDFVHLWVTATHRAGLASQADEIIRRAEDSSKRHLQRPLDPRLRELAEWIRTDSAPSSNGKAMNERANKVVFSNHDNVTVGVQTEQITGNLTISMSSQGISMDVQNEAEET